MGKRFIVLVCCLVFSVSLIAGTMFATDYYRCSKLQKPIFAIGIDTADDGGSGTYQGLGYTVTIGGELTAEYGFTVYKAEMYIFSQLVFAAIT